MKRCLTCAERRSSRYAVKNRDSPCLKLEVDKPRASNVSSSSFNSARHFALRRQISRYHPRPTMHFHATCTHAFRGTSQSPRGSFWLAFTTLRPQLVGMLFHPAQREIGVFCCSALLCILGTKGISSSQFEKGFIKICYLPPSTVRRDSVLKL